MKKILIAASNYWTSPSQVGTHSIARAMVDLGWQVFFVSEPITPFHFLQRNNAQLKQRHEIHKAGGISYFDDKLFTYVPFSLAAPQSYLFLRSRFVHQNWQNFTLPNIIQLIKEKGFGEVDILYFDNSIQSFWLNEIKYKKSIFRFVDNYSGYKKFTKNTKELERFLAENIDVVLYSAENLEKYLEQYSIKEKIFFPNGVDFRHFNNPAEMPEEYNSIKGPIAVYAGEMEVRFDFDLVKIAAKRLPEFSFVLIGEDSTAKRELGTFKNVHLLGRKSFDVLPGYFQHADVGIIPFKTKELGDLIDFVNPLKMHQYFAAGIPVVCSEWDAVKRLNPPAYLFKTEEEFVGYLKQACNEPFDKSRFFEFAKPLDWSEKIKRLLNDLGFADEK